MKVVYRFLIIVFIFSFGIFLGHVINDLIHSKKSVVDDYQQSLDDRQRQYNEYQLSIEGSK